LWVFEKLSVSRHKARMLAGKLSPAVEGRLNGMRRTMPPAMRDNKQIETP